MTEANKLTMVKEYWKHADAGLSVRIRMRPKTYEEVKEVHEEMYSRRLRRVRRLFRKFLYKINRTSWINPKSMLQYKAE